MSKKAPQKKKSISRSAKTKDVRRKSNQKKVLREMATKDTAEDLSIIGNGAASPALCSKEKDGNQRKEDEEKLLKKIATMPTKEELLVIAKTMASESIVSAVEAAVETKGNRRIIKNDASLEQPAALVKGALDTVIVEPHLVPVKTVRANRSTLSKIQAKRSNQEKIKSFQSLRQKTALKSRPMQEKSIIRFASKVKSRKPRTPQPQKVRNVNEDAYPQPHPGKVHRKKRARHATKEEEFMPRIDSAFLLPEADMFVQLEKTMDMTVKMSGDTLPKTGLPMVHGNKDNSGVIIVDGQPFWASNIAADDTDDELVMNAAVLIDVLENRLKLVPMPDIEIILDPMDEITTMAARDKTCYCKDVIFGNTVRSMVNLNEFSVRSLSNRSRRKELAKVCQYELKKLAIVEPIVMHTYYRASHDQSTPVPFTPTSKQPVCSRPPSCTAEVNAFAAV